MAPKTKKKRKSYTPPQRSGTAGSASVDAPSRRADSSTAAKPRQARKEEARQYREAMRRRAARARLLRRGLVVGVVGVGVAALAVSVFRSSNQEPKVLVAATGAAKAAGCTGLLGVPAYTDGNDRAHIGVDVSSPPDLSTYETVPPTSGPHDPTPLDAGVYTSPPAIYQAIHSIEHGAVIIWLAPDASGPNVEKIKSEFANEDKVIVAPYSYPGSAGKLPAGKTIALDAWHRLQTCRDASLPVVRSFVRDFQVDPSNPGAYKGEAPEQGAAI